VTVPSGTATVNLGFWDWRKAAVFVDSYESYFGSEYGNFYGKFTVRDVNKQINQDLGNVVDVTLNTDAAFEDGSFSPKHQYAATWYAGSATPPEKGLQVGLLWSPLIAGSSLPNEKYNQSWPQVDREHQFDLTAQKTHGKTKQPMFESIDLKEISREGGVLGGHNQVTFDDTNYNLSEFVGSYSQDGGKMVGFSFDYWFQGGGDGAKLEMLLNGKPYFFMDASTAVGLPGSGQFSVTFGQSYAAGSGILKLTIRLVKPQGSTGKSTTVTVSNFHQFTLGSPIPG
jgi:hypothetical protein